MPAIVKAQTTKQAKAAYKARGRPNLSDKESRQLQRSIELEERAERAREAEKRRAEAAKKRAEKEQKERPARDNARLGSQRRTDKFGFVASQFHLGKFFGLPRMQSEVTEEGSAGSGGHRTEADLEDEFGSDDLDDDTLLEALKSPEAAEDLLQDPDVAKRSDARALPPPLRPAKLISPQTSVPQPSSRSSAVAMPPPPRPCMSKAPQARAPAAASKPLAVYKSPHRRPAVPSHPQTAEMEASKPAAASKPPSMLMLPPNRPSVQPVPPLKTIVQEDLDSFWNELDSSTQVARDLGDAGSSFSDSKPGGVVDRRSANSSLSVSKPGIVVDEKRVVWSLSGIEPDAAVDEQGAVSFCSGDFDLTKEELDELDPPGPAILPAFQAPVPLPPPPIPSRAAKKVQTRAPPRLQATKIKPQSAIKGPFLPASSLYCSPDLGFTSTQLESFIDDDIQLSQAVPG